MDSSVNDLGVADDPTCIYIEIDFNARQLTRTPLYRGDFNARKRLECIFNGPPGELTVRNDYPSKTRSIKRFSLCSKTWI